MVVILNNFVETLDHRTAKHSPLIHVSHSFDFKLAKRNKNNLIS